MLAALALGVALLVWNLDQPPFDLTRFESMRVGQSECEVEALLGTPRDRLERTWTYSHELSWPIVYVVFDDDRRVRSWRYDR